MNNVEMLSLTIRKIIELKGLSVFNNSKLFFAMLDDLLPQLIAERNIFHRILSDEILKEIMEIQNIDSDQSKNIFWAKIERKLIDYYGFREEWSRIIILSFSSAFANEDSSNYMELSRNSIAYKDVQTDKEHGFDSRRNVEEQKQDFRIVVVGIGGAGNCFIDRAIRNKITGIEYIAVNADESELSLCRTPKRILVGKRLTKGLGVAENPELGEKAAEESIEDIKNAIRGFSLIFISCGMGGGMGTGGSPVVARLAKEMGILTIGLVTTPFRFEAKKRYENAVLGIKELEKYVDALFMLSNDKLLEVVDRKATMPEALRVIDGVFWKGVTAIMNLIDPNTYNYMSLEELKNILKGKGHAHIGYAIAKGKEKIIAALEMVKNSPWLEISISDASQVIIYVLGDISGLDASYVARNIYGCRNLIYGAKYDSSMQNEVEIIMMVFEKTCKNNEIGKMNKESGKRDTIAMEKKTLKIPDFLQRK